MLTKAQQSRLSIFRVARLTSKMKLEILFGTRAINMEIVRW